MKPVERKTYSVTRQMIIAIFPIIYLWAAYRIQKLRMFLLIIFVGFWILWTVVDYAMYGDSSWDEDTPMFPDPATMFYDTTSMVIYILEWSIEILVGVFLMRKWTIEWNKKIESTEK